MVSALPRLRGPSMGLVSTGLGTMRKGFGSFAGIAGEIPPKAPMMSEPFGASLPFPLPKLQKAIRESEFYRD